MSFLSRLFSGDASAPARALGIGVPGVTQVGIVSPWQDSSTLAHIAYSELFAGGADIVDRAAAMRVPPIKRGRAILVGSIADLPLEAGSWSAGEWVPAKRQPTWLNRSTTAQTPFHRMANTVDDLIFHGWSLWALNRSETGTILDAVHVQRSRWSFDAQAPLGIRLGDKPLTDAASVILFQGPDEGLLATGADVVRGARAMDAAWVGRAQNPSPLIVLHETERNGVTQDEAEQYVKAWSAARVSPTGAVGFLPSTLNLETPGNGGDADMFIGGRNAIRLDVANLLNLPASLLDGSTATASLTYQTAEGEFSQLNEWLSYWIAPIEARLSQADVTPQGTVVRFDRSTLSNVPTDSHGPELGTDAPEAVESNPEIEAAA